MIHSRREDIRLALVAVGCLVCTPLAGGSVARGQDLASAERSVAAIERASADLLAVPMSEQPLRSANWAEERLAEAEMYFRLGDYQRSGLLLTDLVENHPEVPATAEARLMLADSLFESGEMIGASQRYRDVLDRSQSDPTYRRYAERALGRVVEIALRTRRFEGLDAYLARASGDPGSEAASATAYFRGKYLYGLAVPESVGATGRVGSEGFDAGRLEEARRLFASVGDDTTYGAQAHYFVGVIHVLRQELGQAIEAFRGVTRLPVESPEQRRVQDLAFLAIGRVQHALRLYPAALEAYGQVPRTSAVLPRALFETAWVQVALEDNTAAARTLEVLVLAAPDSPLIPEAQLLRANLLLRSGHQREADVIFTEVGETARPVLEDLDRLVQQHEDLVTHFASVVREQRESFSVDTLLPESARRWSVEDPQFDRAVAALTELTTTRRLIRETADLVERLGLALESRTVVNVFSDTREQAQIIEALRNRIEAQRAALARAEERASTVASPELRAARERRRALEAELGSAPTTGDSIEARDERRVQQLRMLGRRLREVEVEIMGLDARITATEHFLATRPMSNASGTEAVRAELAMHRSAVAAYRAHVVELRRAIELARMDVGVGDDLYVRDAETRTRYEAALAEERRLSGQVGGPAEAYYRRLAAVERGLVAREAEILGIVRTRTATIRAVVTEESRNLQDYRATLASLEGDAEVVVGGVSAETFRRVRGRFYDIIIRSEIGHVDVAWVEREQHRQELEELTQTRAAELEEIDSEFNDITDANRRPPGTEPAAP